MDTPLTMSPRRVHLTRLMSIWRSAGWLCRDAVELDLVAAGWATLVEGAGGHETIRLTPAGIRLLADFRQRNQRALSDHDRLAGRVAANLMAAGRIVWQELSLRARIDVHDPASDDSAALTDEALWVDDEPRLQPPHQGKAIWRMARPDVFSVRRTSVEEYLRPTVHEVKVSRADLLSDLRHAAKRESYQWLSCETFYVFPAGVAEPREIPETFGIWVLNGSIEAGTLELIRPARHVACKLPFPVWMTLAAAPPTRPDGEAMQRELADVCIAGESIADAAIEAALPTGSAL